MDKRSLSERDICTKFIAPALRKAGWDEMLQIREEVGFTKGRIIVRGKLVSRGQAKRADYVLFYKPNIPLALIEAKDNTHSVGDGMQQGLDYATTLDIPFVFSSNGDGFVFHDRTGRSATAETDLGLDAFPSPADLWARYRAWKGLDAEAEQIVLQDYFDDGSGKAPRYYQVNAVNAAIEAIAKGQDRVLLVMATGTGKTYTAFQIIWRLWIQEDARFALDALPALTTRPDQIKRLRQTILNLAVRGKLVPQEANDEPASELLKRIAQERAEIVKNKEIRREDPLDPVLKAEVPFDVPASWIWSRIGDAVLFTQYGTSQKANPSETGVPVLTMGNVQDGLVIWSNEKRIPETSEDLPALYLRKFDLLYNRTNSAELVGKTGIYLGEDGIRTFASYLIRLRPSLLSSNPRFLNIAMNTPEFRETQILPLIKKQTGQANVNGSALKNMLFPLPPLAEQHRIVAKVDALMTLCDRLEASLDATAATRRRLLDALLTEALAPVDLMVA
jgi:hypothetical protein